MAEYITNDAATMDSTASHAPFSASNKQFEHWQVIRYYVGSGEIRRLIAVLLQICPV